MSKAQLEVIRSAILAGKPAKELSIDLARAGFHASTAAMLPAMDVVFSEHEFNFGAVVTSQAPTARSSHQILYLHGGAYVLGSARGYRNVTGELSRHAFATVVAPDYRLAPEHPFPAAVEDGLAAYRHLLQTGTDASHLSICGDSAGGGLAVAVLLAAKQAGLPLPSSACLLSPWLDLTMSGESLKSRQERDFILDRTRLAGRVQSYLGDQPRDTPLASPIFGDLAGFPQMLVQVGEAEILLSECIRFAGVCADARVRINLDIWPEMPHVWHRFWPQLDEAGEAIAAAGQFIDRCFGRTCQLR